MISPKMVYLYGALYSSYLPWLGRSCHKRPTAPVGDHDYNDDDGFNDCDDDNNNGYDDDDDVNDKVITMMILAMTI